MGRKANILIGVLVLGLLGALGFALLRQPDDTELRTARAEAQQCARELSELKDRTTKLREALTRALAHPETIRIDDPELLRLTGQPVRPTRGGELSQAAVVQVVQSNKGQFQSCYERALKRNTELRGVSVRMNLSFAVRGNGSVGNIQIQPRVDESMVACMSAAIGRWRFPAFGGAPVRVEIPVPLVPKE